MSRDRRTRLAPRVMRKHGRLLLLAIVAIAALSTRAAAHQTSVKYVDVTVEGTRARIQFTVAPSDVTEAEGSIAGKGPREISAAVASTPAVAAYVARWLAIAPEGGPEGRPEGRPEGGPEGGPEGRPEGGPEGRPEGGPEGRPNSEAGPPCPASVARAHPDPDARFVIVEWEVECGGEPSRLARLALDFRGFFAVDSRHEAIVTVHVPGATGDATVVRAPDPILHVQAGEPVGLMAWIAAGIEHIWDGRDHVSFVLALLLVVMLTRRRSEGTAGPRGVLPAASSAALDDPWTTRAPLVTLRHTATIITAFTVAHSLSLIAASLGWIQLPSRLVESLIAFSILYTAVENVMRPDVPWRFALTFGFGLVHGLGFASVLQVMLPPDHIVPPLLGFNLGVEVGQLVIVAIGLPLAWLAARELGATRYRRRIMPAISIAIGLFAVKWLIERAFAVSLITFWGM